MHSTLTAQILGCSTYHWQPGRNNFHADEEIFSVHIHVGIIVRVDRNKTNAILVA